MLVVPGRSALIERSPFLTVRVGTLKTEADFRQALSQIKPISHIDRWASEMISQPTFADSIPQTKEDIGFVMASNEELGSPSPSLGCSWTQAYEAGIELGWEPCLASDGPEIRRHYLKQPPDDKLLIVMEPLARFDGRPQIFGVDHRCSPTLGGLWLSSYGGDLLDMTYGRHWVFRRN